MFLSLGTKLSNKIILWRLCSLIIIKVDRCKVICVTRGCKINWLGGFSHLKRRKISSIFVSFNICHGRSGFLSDKSVAHASSFDCLFNKAAEVVTG